MGQLMMSVGLVADDLYVYPGQTPIINDKFHRSPGYTYKSSATNPTDIINCPIHISSSPFSSPSPRKPKATKGIKVSNNSLNSNPLKKRREITASHYSLH